MQDLGLPFGLAATHLEPLRQPLAARSMTICTVAASDRLKPNFAGLPGVGRVGVNVRLVMAGFVVSRAGGGGVVVVVGGGVVVPPPPPPPSPPPPPVVGAGRASTEYAPEPATSTLRVVSPVNDCRLRRLVTAVAEGATRMSAMPSPEKLWPVAGSLTTVHVVPVSMDRMILPSDPIPM